MAKIYKLEGGTSIVDGIIRIAEREGVKSARVEGIGGVNEITIAYYQQRKKKYEEHRYRGFFEVTSLIGNITVKNGEPFLHAHVTLGKRDMSVIGGHLISGTIFPFLEVVMTPTENRAIRKFDPETGLNVIERIE